MKRMYSLDHIKTWSDARLLIFDEISFAGKDIIIKLDRKLRELKENSNSNSSCICGGFPNLNLLLAIHYMPLWTAGNGMTGLIAILNFKVIIDLQKIPNMEK